MLLSTRAAYVKLLACAATIGAIAAAAVSFTMPRRYISTAVMRLAPPTVTGAPDWQIQAEAAHRLQNMRAEVLSPRSLAGIIQRPAIDLYRQERATRPLEDVIDDMRGDVRIELVPARARGQGRTPPSFRLSFEYPDRVKAQAVVRQLTARLSELNSGTAAGELVGVLAPASLPEKPSRPDRLAIVAIGLGVGLAIGTLFAFLHRRGLKWTLRVAGCAVAGFVLAAAVSLLMPDAFADAQKSYQFVGLGACTGVACGAFLLRVRGKGGSYYTSLILFCVAAGAIATGFASFALPERYLSTAAIRVFPSPGGATPLEIEPADRLREIAQEVLSRGSLSELIHRPSLDLYREERSRRPLEDIIEDMRRRDIRIAPTPPPSLTGLGPAGDFQISFEYADRYKAQAVASELAKKFVEFNVTAERTLDGKTMPGGLGLEVAEPAMLQGSRLAPADAPSERTSDRETMSGSLVLDAVEYATLPASPVSPNRPAAAAIGLLAGMLLGSLLALRDWLVARQASTPGPHPSYWKYTVAAAAIGAVAAGLGSFAIPNRYLSTAVLRVVPFRVGGAGAAQAEIEYTARLSQLTEEILSRSSLAELIQRPSLDLYRLERRRRSMEDIIDDMRHRDLRITPTETMGFTGSSRLIGFQIAFEYVDRDKAQAVVRELTTKFTEGIVAADRGLHRDKMPGSLALEVADSATLPDNPVSPNRPAIAAIGLLAGILLGSFLALRHRPDVLPQPAAIGPHPSYWKYALTTAALGAIAASLGSLAFPKRYVSTAVLRMLSTDPRSAQSATAAGEHVQEMFRPVLSRDSLAEIIQQPALQLYAPERRRRPLDEVVQRMRDRDLQVAPLRDSPFGGRPAAFRISFEYSDAAKARSCVAAIVSKFMTTPEQFVTFASTAASPRERAPAYLEVLDTASTPERSVSPNRAAIGVGGGLAGLLLGVAIARSRRSAPHSAPA